MDLDLTVFELDFDPHNRGKQCIRTINHIKQNCYVDNRRHKPFNPFVGKKLVKYNQLKLLEYAAYLIRKLKRKEFSVSSFEKNLAESLKLCLFFGEKKVSDVKEQDIKEWWEKELRRYENEAISHSTLIKGFECCQVFFKWFNGINGNQKHPLLQNLYIPKKPKSKLIEEMPTQVEVKKLIDAVYTDGKLFIIRDTAILALANDSGARISELLSLRTSSVKPEKKNSLGGFLFTLIDGKRALTSFSSSGFLLSSFSSSCASFPPRWS